MATSLSSQLAALSSQNNSKSKSSGIHAAASSSSSRPRRQQLLPSILHNNAREASSISLVTLRENAAVALDSLWRELVVPSSSDDGMVVDDDDNNRNDMGGSSISSSILLANPIKLLSTSNLDHYERGTSTLSENEIIDGYIEEMLSFLMTCLVEQPISSGGGSGSSTTLMSCLHIFEYLLRKYEIHTRANTASLLLQTVIPFHILVLSHGGGSGHDGGDESSANLGGRVFLRILTLVHDLLQDGTTLPQWSFLLPYAASAASSSSGGGGISPISMLNRHKLAKFVARDDAMTHVIVNIGKKVMEIGLIEGGGGRKEVNDHHGGVGAISVRRGISALLSFSASILVEACSIQLTSNKDAVANISSGDTDGKLIVGGVRESYVRVLFPMVLSACKSGCGGGGGKKKKGSSGGGGGERNQNCYCPEWKEWGRILASTLANSCPFLGRNVKIALCDAIVDGILSLPSHLPSALDGMGTTTTTISKWTDDACSAMMTLLSILATMNGADDDDTKTTVGDEEDSWQYYLPMLPPPRRRNNSEGSAATIIDYIGCELPISTYKRMLSKNDTSAVSKAMGAVVKRFCDERGDDSDDDDDEDVGEITERLTPLLASIIMHAFSRMEKEAIKTMMKSSSNSSTFSASKRKTGSSRGNDMGDAKDDDGFKADREVKTICNMIQEPSLSTLWRSNHSALVAAVTVQTITSFDRAHKQTAQKSAGDDVVSTLILDRYKSIMDGLSTTNSAVHDQGVAYAINTIFSASGSSSPSKVDNKQNLMSHLAQLLDRSDTSTLLDSSSIGGQSTGAFSEAETMNRAVATMLPVRVALENADPSVRLDAITRLNAVRFDNDADMEGVLDHVVDNDLGQALLRRLVMDDDAVVAAAAGEIIASELKTIIAGIDGGMEARPSGFTSLTNDLVALAKEALASLIHWTIIGQDEWSPMTSAASHKATKKKGKQKSMKNVEAKSPILSCISICGSVAKLIALEHESIEMDAADPTMKLFFELFLSLCAHVTIGNCISEEKISPVTQHAISEAASTQLLQLFHDEACDTVADLIAKHPIGQKVLTYCFSHESKKELSSSAKTLMKSRFLWMGLHSLSDELVVPPNKGQMISGNIHMIPTVMLYHVQSYSKESSKRSSFEWEAKFLGDICRRYLDLLLIEDSDGFETFMMNLASISSQLSYEKIIKPVISSFGAPTKKHSIGYEATLLVYACLQPDARIQGISRLLAVTEALFVGNSAKSNVARDCIIPTVALLSHPDRAIRERVIRILELLPSVEKDQLVLQICSKATDKSSSLRSSLVLDGASTLPNLLGQLPGAQHFLLEGCKSSVFTAQGQTSSGRSQSSFIILSSAEKAGENAFPLLKRWDCAGAELFKALLRYNENDIRALPALCRLRDCVLSMLKGVLVNEAQSGVDGLNLQISIGPAQAGRRSRSYSIGASGSFTTLEPYPETMLQAVLAGLSLRSSHLSLTKHLIQLVIERESWANGVFPKLSSKSRNAVASSLLTRRTRDNDDRAGSALLGLPLRALDFMQLLKDADGLRSEADQSAVAFMTDCIRGKLEILGSAGDVSKLSTRLFDQLKSISSVTLAIEGDSGSRDYTRGVILQTLSAIHSHYKSQLTKPSDNNRSNHHSKGKRRRSQSDVESLDILASQAEFLVGLVGGDTSAIHPLNSGRGRAMALSLLTCLCEESPSAVVTSLVPAMLCLAGVSPNASGMSNKKVDMKALGDAIFAIVPAYCIHATSANLSLFNLLERLVGVIIAPGNDNEKSRHILIDHVVGALKLLPTYDNSSDTIASLATCIMAMQAFNLQTPAVSNEAESVLSDTDQDIHARPDVRVLANVTSGMKIAISLSLLQYAEKLMMYICGLAVLSDEAPSSQLLKVGAVEVASLAVRGADGKPKTQLAVYSELTEVQQRSILYLAINLLRCVRDSLSSPVARRAIRKGKGDDADLCLRLWNELMQTHSSALNAHANLVERGMNSMEKKFWDASTIATSDCLETLQNLLPAPHFLASVSSMLNATTADDADSYVRRKTYRLLADRVAELTPDSPEASLFLELMPELLAQIDVDQVATGNSGDDSLATKRRTIVMQQGALIAIESFARSLYPSSENSQISASAAAAFLPALTSVTRLLDRTVHSWAQANDDKSAGAVDCECQLLSSSSLCLFTLVTTLKARCLPHLSSIINPLAMSLKSVNVLLGDSTARSGSADELLQLSVLKTLQAIAETLPQFLSPFLTLLLSENALPSKALRGEHGQANHSVRGAVVQVEAAFATKVQIRQLVPALTVALSKTLKSGVNENWPEACSMLEMMNVAIESSQRSELSPVIWKIFNGLVYAYDYEGSDAGRSQVLLRANKCLLSLVMKMSESQLRPFYARLREWRGPISGDSNGAASSVTRRHAFWSLSAELSKFLRSIFLPCLTSVFVDVIDELEISVSLLCHRPQNADRSKKRRRVEEAAVTVEDLVDLSPLQPLLQCLESALKADAHEGGNWTRGDDNQRYNSILNHLGKLLLAQVPTGTPIQYDKEFTKGTTTSAYQQLIQGVATSEHGNVVGCLTALATAAGNEQLWKPLNFAVLEACGHATRSEVRKAGVSCLLSIIETIGEEYMILLPECLPVLSELLEDDDEIACMAKECVRQGEELLGESLEDSLR